MNDKDDGADDDDADSDQHHGMTLKKNIYYHCLSTQVSKNIFAINKICKILRNDRSMLNSRRLSCKSRVTDDERRNTVNAKIYAATSDVEYNMYHRPRDCGD